MPAINIKDVLLHYQKNGFLLKDPEVVKSGKEATVYKVWLRGERPMAIKLYKDHTTRAFQNNQAYIEGRYFRNPSIRRHVKNRTSTGKRVIHEVWVRREYYLLEKLFKKGAAVPKVYSRSPDSILMDFIGDDAAAPRLIDVELTSKQAKQTLEKVLTSIELFLQVGIVHGDLSAYNILWQHQEPWIIDFPQALDIRQNPNKAALLKRDIDNVLSYIMKFTEVKVEDVYQRFSQDLAGDSQNETELRSQNLEDELK